MAITPASIAVAAGLEVQAIFRDGLNTLRSGEAQYLVDGEPESVSGAISQAAGRSACRIYGTGNIDLPAKASERYERVCRPYLDTIDPGGGAGLTIPFEGGQCEDVVYQFLASGRLKSGNPNFDINSNQKMRGPLSGFRSQVEGTRLKGFLTGKSAATAQSCQVASGGIGALQEREIFDVNNRSGYDLTFSITGVCGGGANNCGNPPPEVGPPVPIPDPNPPPFSFNPTTNIDVDIDVDLNVDGSLTVNIGTGPITIDPFTDNPFDDGGGGDSTPPTGPDDGPVGDPGTPGTPVETDEDGDAEEEAPPDSVLVGLVIDILESPPGANEFRPGVFRGAAYIYMGTPGALDQDFGGSMIRSGQFFFAEKDNLTVWEVNANIGFRLRVTPYYREVD